MSALPANFPPGIAMAAVGTCLPLYAHVFGKHEAQTLVENAQRCVAGEITAEAFLELADEIDAVDLPGDLDAGGFFDLYVLAGESASHVRWVSYLYGTCRAKDHARIEALVQQTGAYASLDEALAAYMSQDAALGILQAMEASEDAYAKASPQDVAIVEGHFGTNPIFDTSYFIAAALHDFYRIVHIRAVIDSLPTKAGAEVERLIVQATTPHRRSA